MESVHGCECPPLELRGVLVLMVTVVAMHGTRDIIMPVTNIFGGIMGYKLMGENKVREIYASAPKGVSYTIVSAPGATVSP